MNRLIYLLSGALLVAGYAVSLAQERPPAERSLPGVRDESTLACERAVQQSLTVRNGAPADLRFSPLLAARSPAGSAAQQSLRGAGTWRDAKGNRRRFEYRCDIDAAHPESVGVIIRDLTPAQPAPKQAAIEPDLRNISPRACESAAAVALGKRWPQVSQISFDSRTRRITQSSVAQALLREQGSAMPSPGAPIAHFEISCEVDPRDGRVIRVQVSE